MNRFLQIFNLLGVAVLAVLLCLQWNADSVLNAQLTDSDKSRQDQAQKLDQQEGVLKEDATSMDDLRSRLSISESSLKDAQTALAAKTAERDQLKSALDKWTAAVAQRDDALKQSAEQITKLAKDRDDAVGKFNDLVGKYNSMVKEKG